MSGFDPIWILRTLMGVILVVGTLTAYYGLSAWWRTRSRPMLFMGLGFVLISLAAALAGLVYELLTHDLLTAWIVSAGLSSMGFLVILYSLWSGEGPKMPPEAPEVPSP